MKTKINKLSQVLTETLHFIKSFKKLNKTGPTVAVIAYKLNLSYSATRERVMKLIKSKEVFRDKKTKCLTVK